MDSVEFSLYISNAKFHYYVMMLYSMELC